jgi:hypothetical protein
LDWKWIKEIAFGALNLSHEVFWKLTPSEFLDLYDGWLWRENRNVEEQKSLHDIRMREYSVLASWITAPHVKKPLKPTDFYDPDKLAKLKSINEERKQLQTPEEKKSMFDNLEKQLGVK